MIVRILLADLIQKKRVTKKWVSEQTGIREGTIRDYCQGWANSININHISAICTVMDCGITDLFQSADEEAGLPITYPKNLTEADKNKILVDIYAALSPLYNDRV